MCRECGLWLSDWKKQALPLKQISEHIQAVPLGEHQHYSPDCPFVKAHTATQAIVSATSQATQRFAPGGISQWCNTEAFEAGLKASKQQADQSLQDMWEQYKQRYMTPAKTPIEISTQKPSKTTPQSAAQATSQPLTQQASQSITETPAKTATLEISRELSKSASSANQPPSQVSPLARDKQEPPGKQCAQPQKHVASQPLTQQVSLQAASQSTPQEASLQATSHASLQADLLPAKQAGPLDYHICKLCNAAFSSIARLICHTQNSTCNKPRCKLCEQTFASKNQLHQHLRTECKYSRNNRIQSSKCDLSSESPQRLAAPRSAASTLIPAKTPHSAETSSSKPTVIARSAPATPPATPPPTYRAISPPPPAYKATKAYLTIEDLYMRYAPLKALRSARQSAHQSACSKATRVSSYLTINDLFRRFSKRTSAKSGPAADKPASKSSATAISKQCKQSDTELNRIQLARQDKYMSDLETSAIDSVRSRKSNAKTSDICFLPQVQKLQQRPGSITKCAPLGNQSYSFPRGYLLSPRSRCLPPTSPPNATSFAGRL